MGESQSNWNIPFESPHNPQPTWYACNQTTPVTNLRVHPTELMNVKNVKVRYLLIVCVFPFSLARRLSADTNWWYWLYSTIYIERSQPRAYGCSRFEAKRLPAQTPRSHIFCFRCLFITKFYYYFHSFELWLWLKIIGESTRPSSVRGRRMRALWIRKKIFGYTFHSPFLMPIKFVILRDTIFYMWRGVIEPGYSAALTKCRCGNGNG